MRQTQVLLRWFKGPNHIKEYKNSWRRVGVKQNPELIVPAYLKKRGVEIVDAVSYYKNRDNPPPPEWKPPVEDDPRFMEELAPQEHPDYNDVPSYTYNTSCKLLEGEKQAFLLTKSQVFRELPQKILDLIGAVKIPNQDKIIQRYIMQANIWDPTKDLLPKRKATNITYNFKAERGIPNNLRTSILIRNLLRLSKAIEGDFPEIGETRTTVHNSYSSSFFQFGGNKTIRIVGNNEYAVSSSSPLESFAEESVIDDSVNHTIEDLFPVSPTIDLDIENIYKLENITGWNSQLMLPSPHTIYINASENSWSEGTTSERNAKAVMMLFGNCLAYAKEKYGWDVKHLPEPISAQCVITNGEIFTFVAFQLNTLSFESMDGVKNLVWIDEDNYMYKKILPKRAMLRNTDYQDYNPEVFEKMLAFQLNGVVQSSVNSTDREKASARF